MAAFFKDKAAGLLLQKELDYLSRVLLNPDQPFVTILGGAKVSDKIGVIKNLLPKVNALLIGGGMAILSSKQKESRSAVRWSRTTRFNLRVILLKEAGNVALRFCFLSITFPETAKKRIPWLRGGSVPSGRMGLDIGPKTIALFIEQIQTAKMVLWNGPVGLFEVEPYNRGSLAIAEALAQNHSKLVSIIAGGDTVAAVAAAGVEDKISHLSTGGGATLEFLEGRKLPGIEALEVAT